VYDGVPARVFLGPGALSSTGDAEVAELSPEGAGFPLPTPTTAAIIFLPIRRFSLKHLNLARGI
jgi:hypothetical protein